MTFGIVAKPHRTDFAQHLREVFSWLVQRGCRALVDAEVVQTYGLTDIPATPRQELTRRSDVIVVFGGDGTMLSVVRSIGGLPTPILGVNMGTLGFLTSVKLEELYPALEKILNKDCKVDRRGLLKTEVHCSGKEPQVFHALNDAVINKGALARIISLETSIDGAFVADFMADGMIISTTTGSTAYSLSAGGPILFPALEALIVTPICPHTLTNRPFVVPSDRLIQIDLKDGDDVMLTMDGQIGVELTPGARITCTRSEHDIDLIHPVDKSFFDVLREKLRWAER